MRPYGRKYRYPCDCNSPERTTPPFSALTKPGSRSVSVMFCAFIVLPQAASSTPSSEKSPIRLLTSGFAWDADEGRKDKRKDEGNLS